jgi:hypothetical protein
MAVGMLTLGNLGMVLGWWADRAPTGDGTDCCGCVASDTLSGSWPARPWMALGMLVAANTAMLVLPRRRGETSAACRAATFGGGNLGMLAGMAVGGWAVAQWSYPAHLPAVPLHFVGMTLGMVLGMWLGHALALGVLRRDRVRSSASRLLPFPPP